MEDTILVMLKTATRSLFSRSACKMYPERPYVPYERTRGRIVIESARCILCTACERRCPTGAILVDRDKHHWMIDRFKCILCGNCLEGCKPNSLRMDDQYAGPVVEKQTEVHAVPPPRARKMGRIEKPPGPPGE